MSLSTLCWNTPSLGIPESEKQERTRSRGLVLGVEGQKESVLCDFLARAEPASSQSSRVCAMQGIRFLLSEPRPHAPRLQL